MIQIRDKKLHRLSLRAHRRASRASVARDMAAKVYEACSTILSFTIYVNEKRDTSMEEYVRDLMGDEEYQEFKALRS